MILFKKIHIMVTSLSQTGKNKISIYWWHNCWVKKTNAREWRNRIKAYSWRYIN